MTKVDEVNKIGSDIVELIQIGGLHNFSINDIQLLPAIAPAMPSPPVVPPEYLNITDNVNVMLTTINQTVASESPQDGLSPLKFVIPSKLVVSLEPSANVSNKKTIVNLINCSNFSIFLIDWSLSLRSSVYVG